MIVLGNLIMNLCTLQLHMEKTSLIWILLGAKPVANYSLYRQCLYKRAQESTAIEKIDMYAWEGVESEK